MVVGGKGGVVIMMMVGARGRSLREPLFVVVAVHRSGSALPLTGGVQQEWDCDGSGAPPPQPQIPHRPHVQTHGAEVGALASFAAYAPECLGHTTSQWAYCEGRELGGKGCA